MEACHLYTAPGEEDKAECSILKQVQVLQGGHWNKPIDRAQNADCEFSMDNKRNPLCGGYRLAVYIIPDEIAFSNTTLTLAELKTADGESLAVTREKHLSLGGSGIGSSVEIQFSVTVLGQRILIKTTLYLQTFRHMKNMNLSIRSHYLTEDFMIIL